MRKVTSKITLALIVSVVVVSACEKADWYDVKSDASLAVPETIQDMQALLDNETMNNSSPSLGEVGTDGHIARAGTFFSNTEFNAYAWTLEKPFIQVADWSNQSFNSLGPYQKVYICNLILEGLHKVKINNGEDYLKIDHVKGQSLFHRAKAFYEISQIFAPPYQPLSANSDMGIPLRLESNINAPSKRSTIQQTYSQIVDDLVAASDLLPTVALTKNRASRPAAYALLARVYLSMEDYVKAGHFADECLKIHNKLLNYSTLSPNLSIPIQPYNTEVIFHSRMLVYNSIRPSSMIIDTALYTLYDTSDLRLKIFFSSSRQFKGSYAGSSTILFNGLATDEMYLIRAECKARNGKYQEAMDDLNTLLKNRCSSSYVDRKAADPNDALVQILQERKKELLLRGLRWSDLRRFNRDNRFKLTISRSLEGKTYVLEPNSFRYTYPIPQDIVDFTGIPQNIGW